MTALRWTMIYNTKKKVLLGKISGFFSCKLLKIGRLIRNLTHRRPQTWHFFCKNGAFFSNFRKRAGETFWRWWKKMKEDDQTNSMLLFCQRFCMWKRYHYILDTLYDKPSLCVTLRVFSRNRRTYIKKYKATVDPNIQCFKGSFKNFQYDDFKIILSRKICWVEKDNKRTAVSAT